MSRRIGYWPGFQLRGGGSERFEAPQEAQLEIAERPLSLGRDPVLVRWSRMMPKSAADMSRLERRLASGGFQRSTAVVVYLQRRLSFQSSWPVQCLW